MQRSLLVAAMLAMGMVSVAHADKRVPTYRFTDPSRIGAPWAPPVADAVSHVIYLNNCQPSGCTLRPGNNDSTNDISSIPQGQVSVSAYTGSSANWQALVACVQQTYAPFNVQIVTTRPASGDYHMAIVAGMSSDVGEGSGVLGVSPFTCGYIPNSISFTFANEEPTNIDDLCWTVSQETSHSWGLDHKFDNRDPMTYLTTGPTLKTFQNQAGSCGEYSARTCNCTYAGTGDTMENSYALIMATFGASAPDVTPPTVAITAPVNGASVQAGFTVTATVTDDVAVQKAELRIDGTLVSALTGAPWTWTAPASVGQGAHHVEVTGYDLAGNTAVAAVDVTDGMVCTKDADCSGANEVCLDQHCIPGPGATGGLGTTCTNNTDCASGQCASDGTNMYCVEPCNPTGQNQCPSSFGCVSAGGTGGVCWPGADNGSGGSGGGCNTSGDGGPILIGLGFAAVLLTRKRR